MADVVVEPLRYAVKELVGHFRAALKRVTGEFFRELAQVVGERVVFGREVSHLPFMTQAEPQYKFVDELAFSFTGTSGDHDEASGFEAG